MEKIFNTTLKSKSDRNNNLRELLDADKLQRHIKNEVSHHQLGTHSFSGWFTDRLGNYLFDSKNVDSHRNSEYSFYGNESHYWARKVPGNMLLTEDVEEIVDGKDFLREQRENKEAYLSKLFDPDKISEDDYKNFIKAGYFNRDPRSLEIDNEIIIDGMRQMRAIILSACKVGDFNFLKKFNGENSINDIATITGVSHQAVSKKLKKICKNSRKMVADAKVKSLI